MLSHAILTSLVASQISFVVRDATIFDSPRKFVTKSFLISYLLSCKLCLNFWPSLLLTTIEFLRSNIGVIDSFYILFAVWAGAYIIDSAREKYLPCVKCTKQGEISTGSYQVLS